MMANPQLQQCERCKKMRNCKVVRYPGKVRNSLFGSLIEPDSEKKGRPVAMCRKCSKWTGAK